MLLFFGLSYWIAGFGCPFDIMGSQQLLFSLRLWEWGKMVLRAVLVGGVWNGYLFSRSTGEQVLCRFDGENDGDGHLFWTCPFHLLFRE